MAEKCAINVRSSPDRDAYLTSWVGCTRIITGFCDVVTADTYHERQNRVVGLIRAHLSGPEATPSRHTLWWPTHWVGPTPQGIEALGPGWEDAEWLG